MNSSDINSLDRLSQHIHEQRLIGSLVDEGPFHSFVTEDGTRLKWWHDTHELSFSGDPGNVERLKRDLSARERQQRALDELETYQHPA